MERKLVHLISTEAIAVTVNRLAQELDRDYENRAPLLVGILKGSFIFLADLVRKMKTPICSIEFICLSSYGASTVTSGQATMIMGLPKEKVIGKDVIVIEDIVDTGITTATVLNYLKSYNPASVKLCTLLDKPARREMPVTIDYLGLTIPDQFIVGYGIDFNQKYRQLPAIYALRETQR
jgi:hypoxanthine phosphoribosyltransferase